MHSSQFGESLPHFSFYFLYLLPRPRLVRSAHGKQTRRHTLSFLMFIIHRFDSLFLSPLPFGQTLQPLTIDIVTDTSTLPKYEHYMDGTASLWWGNHM
jgi:hypothetical protein